MKKFILQMRSLPIISLFISLALVLYLVSASLNPFDGQMFEFHDETQTGRINGFVMNLKNGEIPPRIGPEYSFRLGFPVFNYYAPTAYWITSAFALGGVSELVAVKISFLVGVIAAFLAMLYLLTRFFDYYSSLLGASAYVTSTYMATEIVIRGNLAETWFLVFLPLGLGLIVENSRSTSVKKYIAMVFALALLFTSHNMLSLLAIPITIIVAFLLPNAKRNIIGIGNALLFDSYFLIPAFLESSFVQAKSLATLFDYKKHFLCPWQLWSANGWQFGGSLEGCDADMMSFKLGKPHLLMATSGLLLMIFSFTQKFVNKNKFEKKDLVFGFFGIFVVLSLWLTVEQSRFLWDLFKPIMSLFQFPWRFLVFGMFGIGFFSAYLFFKIKEIKKIPEFLRIIAVFGIAVVLFLSGYKYFVKPQLPHEAYYNRYTSDGYRSEIFAYNVREYLPKDVNYEHWHYLNPLEVNRQPLGFDSKMPVQFDKKIKVEQETWFDKKIIALADGDMYVNVHYLPHWHISVNGKKAEIKSMDKLARPLIVVKSNDVISINYRQTPLEMLANIMTLGSIAFMAFVYKKKLAFI